MSEDKQNQSRKAAEAKERRKRRERKVRVRSLVLGTLAASGAFQLNGWQAQAHGNRSSHATAALRSNLFLPEDYITFRQELTAPRAEQTLVLSRLASRMDALRRSSLDGTTIRGPSGTTRELSESEAAVLGELRENSRRVLQREIDTLEDQLRLRETSRQALEFIDQGDYDAVAAMIEGEGEPEHVTYEYLWTITDIAYLGRKNSDLTAEHLEQLTALSQRAMQYIDEAREMVGGEDPTHTELAVLTRIAEIYHNIASYMVPDIGSPTPEGLRLGHEAARKGYEMRIQLNQPTETLIALWTVAHYEGLVGNSEEAAKLHQEAIAMAERLDQPVQIAWNKMSLARLDDRVSVKGSVIEEIEELLAQARQDDPVAALLRLELDRARGEG